MVEFARWLEICIFFILYTGTGMLFQTGVSNGKFTSLLRLAEIRRTWNFCCYSFDPLLELETDLSIEPWKYRINKCTVHLRRISRIEIVDKEEKWRDVGYFYSICIMRKVVLLKTDRKLENFFNINPRGNFFQMN